MLNPSEIRPQFPGLESEWIFFDNAGGSQILRSALDRMTEYCCTSFVQHGATNAVSSLAQQRVAQAHEALAALVNAADPSEIVTGSSTTQLISNLAAAMMPRFRPGDEIVVTNADHESNIGPWIRLAAHGITIKTWNVRPDSYTLELDDLKGVISDRTRLVCFTHTSNILGAVVPAETITRFVHEYGAQVCIDGVAFAPHRVVDVQALDADYYVFSCYKVFGPHLAMLYGKRSHLQSLANINHHFLADAVPYKLQPGGVNYESTYAMLGVVEYLERLAPSDPVADARHDRLQRSFDAIARYEEELATPLLAYLAGREDISIIGPEQPDRELRVPTISFVAQGRQSDEITRALDDHKIGTRFGHFYAKRLIDDLSLARHNGVVRISMAHYNTREEVQRLIEALELILEA